MFVCAFIWLQLKCVALTERDRPQEPKNNEYIYEKDPKLGKMPTTTYRHYRCLWWQYDNDSFCGLYANCAGNKSYIASYRFALEMVTP